MKEMQIGIPQTGMRVSATLRGSLDAASMTIMLSGDGRLQSEAADFLLDCDYSTLSISAYDVPVRRLADDLTAITSYVQRSVNRVYAVGHGRDGLAILDSGALLAGAVLWEPAPSPKGPNIARKEYPLLIVSAGASALAPHIAAYDAAAIGQHKVVRIEGATPDFLDSEAVQTRLYSATRDWLGA